MKHSDPGQAQLYNEIELEVTKILASASLSYPQLQSFLGLPALQKLCALMYSEGLRKGVEKAQEAISQ